jgi:hydrogenase large subunit
VTEPNYVLGKNAKGTSTRIEELDESAKYSWIKAPRWRGHAMEVGLARYIIGYQQGRPDIKEQVDGLLRALDVPMEAMFSTLGRTAARALEAQWAAEKQQYFLDKLIANIKAGDTATANTAKFDPSTWPDEVKGVGFSERRAALWPTGSGSGRARSTITNAWCPAPGTVPARQSGQHRGLRGIVAEHQGRARRGAGGNSGRCTALTHAWPVRPMMGPDGRELAEVKVR